MDKIQVDKSMPTLCVSKVTGDTLDHIIPQFKYWHDYYNYPGNECLPPALVTMSRSNGSHIYGLGTEV